MPSVIPFHGYPPKTGRRLLILILAALAVCLAVDAAALTAIRWVTV